MLVSNKTGTSDMDPLTLLFQVIFYSTVAGAYFALLSIDNNDDDDDQDGGILQPCYVTDR